MSKLLVFQHVASEPLGHLDPLLRASGFRIRYVNFGREAQAQPDIRRYDGLVVLGGPMNVDQVEQFPHLTTEIALIREAVREHLKRLTTRELELQERQAYDRLPDDPQEFAVWDKVAAWPRE